MMIVFIDYSTPWLHQARYWGSYLLSPIIGASQLPSYTLEQFPRLALSKSELFNKILVLESENLALKSQNLSLQGKALENKRLHSIVSFQQSIGFGQVAQALTIDRRLKRHHMLINRGQAHGIVQGAPVFDTSGVVGQVTRVLKQAAWVLLLTDVNHGIPVEVESSGYLGVAAGLGDTQYLNLDHRLENQQLKIGDVLVTSGLGAIFPQGYPVATVVSVNQLQGSIFTDVQLKPLAELERSRYFIVGHPRKDAALINEAVEQGFEQ